MSLLTSFIKAVLQNLLDGLLRGLQCVLPPALPVVTAEDDDLPLAASQRGEVRHLDDDGAEELCPGRSELQHSAGNGLALHQGWGVDQLVLLQISRNTSLTSQSEARQSSLTCR